MKILLTFCLIVLVLQAKAQNTPVFNGRQLIDVTEVTWNFATRPAGWYRIGKISGGMRGNATFELRENADHSTLRFELGVNFNNGDGSSFTQTNHSYYGSPTFAAIRVLTGSTYDDTFLEVYVYPHNNDNNVFAAYVINPLAAGEWTLINWTPGNVPEGYLNSQFNTVDLLSVGNIPHKNIFSVQRSGNVGIGTVDTHGYKLAVNGNIRAKEIKVETGWSDFVFEPDYKLLSLNETEQYIKKNGHLPEIPSAKEVEANGINLGEMNAKLLQKIEELTLHIIDQNKRLEDLETKRRKK